MAKLTWIYEKNPHQAEFHKDTISPRLHLSTGVGGGKTHGLIMKTFQLSWLNRHLNGGFMAPSYKEFKKDCLPLFEEILDKHKIKYSYNKTDMIFRFPWSRGKLYVVTGQEKIRGPNWAYACINELTLIPLVRYQEVIGRVRIRSAKAPQVASCGTPEGWANEYYEFMIESPRANTRIIYGNTRDNQQNLAVDYVTNLEETYDSQMLQTYLEGLWVNLSGHSFYYNFSPDRNEDKTYKATDWGIYHIGMDFNVDYMSCNIWQYDGYKLRGVDEITLPKNADTKKMCIALGVRGYNSENTILYPDPAGNARSTKGKPDIHILRENGFWNIKVKSKAATHRQRQLHMNNLLEKGRIIINPEKQKAVKKDLIGVEMDPIRLEKVKKNEKLTHHSDGLDYLCDILMPFKKPSSRSIIGTRL